MTRRINGLIAFLMAFFLVLLIAPVIAYGTPPNKKAPDPSAIATSTSEAISASKSISAAEALANATGGTATLHNNSKVLSVSGSGMEIRDCIATHALLFGLWQGTHINALCEAANMNANGQYLAAAKMKCSTKKFKKVYGNNCIKAVILSAPPVVIIESEDDDEDDDRYEALYARLSEMEAERVQDKAKAEKASKRAYAKAVRAEEQEQQTAKQDLETYREIISE